MLPAVVRHLAVYVPMPLPTRDDDGLEEADDAVMDLPTIGSRHGAHGKQAH